MQTIDWTLRGRLDALVEGSAAIVDDYAEELDAGAPTRDSRRDAALRRCAAWLDDAAALLDELGPDAFGVSEGRRAALTRMCGVVVELVRMMLGGDPSGQRRPLRQSSR